MTNSNYGEIVSGTLIQFTGDDTVYMVGEVYTNNCKLYDYKTAQYKGLYNTKELKAYVR